MTCLGRTLGFAAALTVVAAGSAVAEPTPRGNDDIAEAAELTWAEGPGEDGARVRMFVGEIDGRGVVYAEYYQGDRLWMAVPYNRVFIGNDSESSVRSLRGLEMHGPTADGFAFVADEGTVQLKCTALLWADATINCTRGTFAPKGSASCAHYFKSNNERFQCNGIQAAFPTPQIPHDDLHALCARSFRPEAKRNECIMLGYNAPSAATFRDALSACTAAYRTQDERSFCMVLLLGTPAPRPSVDLVRKCDREHADDKATTDCVWLEHTGVEQVHPKSRTSLPTDEPTAPVARNAKPSKKRLSGGRIDVASGTWRDLSVRATGGMVGTEPVLWVDGFRGSKHEWMSPIDRIVIGTQVRALREVRSLDKVKLSGELLTFRAALGSKQLQCRADVSVTFATCR